MNPEELRISVVNFPDGNFRAVITNAFDTDQSGWLTEAEIAQASEIVLEDFPSVASLQGMEYLTAVTGLIIGDTLELTGLDLNGNAALTNVDIYRTGLSELDISPLNLSYLGVTHSPLTSLSLGNQPGLSILYAHGCALTELDISGCPLLIDVFLHGTRTEADGAVEYTDSVTFNTLKLDAGVRVITGLERTVRFVASGGTPEAETRVVISGETVAEPMASVTIGAVFTGWYTDEACAEENLYNFSTPVTENMTLYAGWLIPAPAGVLRLPAMLTEIDAQRCGRGGHHSLHCDRHHR